MIYLAATAALGLLAWSLNRFRALETAGSAIALARDAVTVLFDPSLSDAEKERAARASSVKLLVQAATIAGRLALALAIPLSFLGLFVAARLLSVAALVQLLGSWEFVAASTIVIAAALLWRR